MATASSGKAVVTLPTETQIRIEREFAAPQHLVYRTWTTPEYIRRWWTAKRGEAINTVTFTEVDGRRTVTILVEAGSREVRDTIIASGMEDGLQDALDLLEELAISLQ